MVDVRRASRAGPSQDPEGRGPADVLRGVRASAAELLGVLTRRGEGGDDAMSRRAAGEVVDELAGMATLIALVAETTSARPAPDVEAAAASLAESLVALRAQLDAARGG